MKINTSSLLARSAAALAVVVASIAAPSVAEAGRCNVVCSGGRCRINVRLEPVVCYCKDGQPICALEGPSPVSDPGEQGAEPEEGFAVGDDEVFHLEELARQAYALNLDDLGDAATRLQAALEDGDAAFYPRALVDYEAALMSLSAEEREQMEIGSL